MRFTKVACPICNQKVRRYFDGTYSMHYANNMRCNPGFVYDPLHTDEHTEQALVIEWARAHTREYPPLQWLYSNMNGIPLPGSRKTRGRIINHMKAEGMVRGVLDLFLPYPHRGYHGFYMEMKKIGGSISLEQELFKEYVTSQHYYASVFYGHKSAIQTLIWYLT